MCGLAGLLNLNRKPVEFVPLARMVNQLNHRGRNDLGTCTETYVSLVQTHLSSIDLASGQATMHNQDKSPRHIIISMSEPSGRVIQENRHKKND